jgi:hypothetical protein
MKMGQVRVYGTYSEVGLILVKSSIFKRIIQEYIKMDITDMGFGEKIGFSWLRLG